MAAIQGVILCLGWIVGLLATGLEIPGFPQTFIGIPPLGYAVLITGCGLSVILPRRWRAGPPASTWVIAGLLGFVASGYLLWRAPHPGSQDISQLVEQVNRISPEQVVQGQVIAEPRLTRSQKGQFWLRVHGVRSLDETGQSRFKQVAKGKLYVTAPLLHITGLVPGETVELTGQLYLPEASQNPGGFDFSAYLAQMNSFAGFKATKVVSLTPETRQSWGLWRIRQQIVKAQVRWLDSPVGPLVSAMALGRQAVDLPFDVRDAFIQAGLAHTLAASGFQVALVLSLVLGAMKSFSVGLQVGVGGLALAAYIGLTGIQPSVMRAGFMGAGALIGLAADRRVNTLNCLLVAVTALLVFTPGWIWDIGFQLSVLATLGLIVTATPLAERLDWLPINVATLVAVPLAAFGWTLPLQIFYFHAVPTYSLLLNIVVTPLITVMSLGGVFSGLAALIWAPAGSAIAFLLYYPVQLLIGLVEFCNHQPGNSLALGQMALWQVLGVYGLIGMAWLVPWWQRRRWLAGGLALGLLVVPLSVRAATLTQATVLATRADPVVVLQTQRQTLVINSGTERTAFYTVLPFLKQAGIRHVDAGVTALTPPDYPQGWKTLSTQFAFKTLYGWDDSAPALPDGASYTALPVGQTAQVGAAKLQRIGTDHPIVRLAFQDQSWLLLPPLPSSVQTYLAKAGSVLQSRVLWWDGSPIAEPLLTAIQPAIALCSGPTLDPVVEQTLRDRAIQVFWTERDGAIQWTPQQGFQTFAEQAKDDIAILE